MGDEESKEENSSHYIESKSILRRNKKKGVPPETVFKPNFVLGSILDEIAED